MKDDKRLILGSMFDGMLAPGSKGEQREKPATVVNSSNDKKSVDSPGDKEPGHKIRQGQLIFDDDIGGGYFP